MPVPGRGRVEGLTFRGNMECRLIMLATPMVGCGFNWPGAEQNPAYRLSVT